MEHLAVLSFHYDKHLVLSEWIDIRLKTEEFSSLFINILSALEIVSQVPITIQAVEEGTW